MTNSYSIGQKLDGLSKAEILSILHDGYHLKCSNHPDRKLFVNQHGRPQYGSINEAFSEDIYTAWSYQPFIVIKAPILCNMQDLEGVIL